MVPRTFTLRRLKQMADAKREHEYDVAISHACYISGVLNGKFNPNTANPITQERTRQLQNKLVPDPRGMEAFSLLGAGLRMMTEHSHGNR